MKIPFVILSILTSLSAYAQVPPPLVRNSLDTNATPTTWYGPVTFDHPSSSTELMQFNVFGSNLFYFSVQFDTFNLLEKVGAGSRWIWYSQGTNFNFGEAARPINVEVTGNVVGDSGQAFATSQKTPSSNLTNYTVDYRAETWVNATNKLNFSSFFLMGGAYAAICNVVVSNYTGTNQPISFVGATGISWESDVPTIMTNGTIATLATKHMSNAVTAVWSWEKSRQ